jgi:pseudouridine-5'-phosphate glycosidase
MDRAVHDWVLADALAAADAEGVRGKDVTPFLLDFFHRETHGASLSANVALVLSNARLAAEIAAADDDAVGAPPSRGAARGTKR